MEPSPPEPIPALLRSREGVTLVGAGPVAREALEACLARAPATVAADGGAGALLAAGRLPDAVIGDLDSLPAEDRARIPAIRVHRVAEQDSTDFEKCLARIEAPFVLAVGFLGGRADHALAALSVLARGVGPTCVLVSETDALCHAPQRLDLDLPPGARVSLFPMASVTGVSEGLRWPIEGLAFAPSGRVGTSNEALGPVRLALDGPGMLVIVARAGLGALLAGLGLQAGAASGRRVSLGGAAPRPRRGSARGASRR